MSALAAIALGGVILGPTQPAEATSVADGKISIDAPNPLAAITLDGDYQQQITSTEFGDAFYSPAEGPRFMPTIYDLDENRTVLNYVDPQPKNTIQQSGGSGTAADPYWLETSGPLPQQADSSIQLRQRLSYVIGSSSVRNDLTLSNTGSSARKLQLSQVADCAISGQNDGYASLIPGEQVECLNAPKTAKLTLSSLSPNAVVVGGSILAVSELFRTPLFGSTAANKCMKPDESLGYTIGDCELDDPSDHGFAVAWEIDLAPGTTQTRSSQLDYTKEPERVDLSVQSSVAPVQVELGGTVTYSLKITNGGPGISENTRVFFALPAGMRFVESSPEGEYDVASGSWNLPGGLAPGAVKTITIAAHAEVAGDQTTKVTSISTDGVDRSPCQTANTCGAPLTVSVQSPVPSPVYTGGLTVSPQKVSVNGVATAAVTLMDESGRKLTTIPPGISVTPKVTNAVAGAVKRNPNATFTFDVTADRAGTATIGFAINGVESSRTQAVEFVFVNAPTVKYANATTVKGTAVPRHTVEVRRAGGQILGTASTKSDGSFSASLSPAAKHQDDLQVTAIDTNGIRSEPTPAIVDALVPDRLLLDVSNGKSISGGVVAKNNTLSIVNDQGERIAGAQMIDVKGNFTFAPRTPLTEDDKTFALITTPTQNISKTPVIIKTTIPKPPSIDEIDPTHVSGCAEAGSTVEARDGEGRVIGTAVVGEDCRFELTFTKPQAPGTSVETKVTDAAGNTSVGKSTMIGKLTAVTQLAAVSVGEDQTIYGYGFSPGEKVRVALGANKLDLRDQIANEDGEIITTFTLPEDLALGSQHVALTGTNSGTRNVDFEVIGPTEGKSGLARTGSDHATVTSGKVAGIALLALGFVIIAARKRRSSSSEW